MHRAGNVITCGSPNRVKGNLKSYNSFFNINLRAILSVEPSDITPIIINVIRPVYKEKKAEPTAQPYFRGGGN